MKVYILNKSICDYEDNYDYILGVYKDKNIAEKEMEKYKTEHDKVLKCYNCLSSSRICMPDCSMSYCNNNEKCMQKRIQYIKKSCQDADLSVTDDLITCKNNNCSEKWFYQEDYVVFFNISEHDVIEK